MDSFLFMLHNFPSLPLKAQGFFAFGLLAFFVAFGLPALLRLTRSGLLIWQRKAWSPSETTAIQRRLRRLELLAELPLPPRSADAFYREAEAVWHRSKDDMVVTLALRVMNRLCRNQQALLAQ